MARPPRLHQHDAVFHVMARGNGGQEIFIDEQDFRRFLRILTRAKERFACRFHAYCLMSNHFHVLLRTTDISLSRVMQWILTCHAKVFNLRRERSGHLFQGRFKSILCQDDRYFLELLRYIHLNPVRARQRERPGDWPWTGHRELCGAERPRILDIGFPLSLFHADTATAMKLYSHFIEMGIAGCLSSPDPFAPTAPKEKRFSPKCVEQPQTIPVTISLAELAESVSKETGLGVEALIGAGRAREIAHARRLMIHQAISHGIRPSAIASFMNCSPSVISKALRTR